VFEKLISFTKKVADLADRPSLNSTELKAQFDAAPDEVREYLNKLIDALKKTEAGDSGAKNIGVTTISGITGNDIQTVLEALAPVSGSTLNGSFIKYPDGTMICRHSLNTSGTGATYYGNANNPYPASFVGSPMVFISAYNNSGGQSAIGTAATLCLDVTTGWRWGAEFKNAVPSGSTVYVSLLAIGRWK
jgi:hypothetical protein